MSAWISYLFPFGSNSDSINMTIDPILTQSVIPMPPKAGPPILFPKGNCNKSPKGHVSGPARNAPDRGLNIKSVTASNIFIKREDIQSMRGKLRPTTPNSDPYVPPACEFKRRVTEEGVDNFFLKLKTRRSSTDLTVPKLIPIITVTQEIIMPSFDDVALEASKYQVL